MLDVLAGDRAAAHTEITAFTDGSGTAALDIGAVPAGPSTVRATVQDAQGKTTATSEVRIEKRPTRRGPAIRSGSKTRCSRRSPPCASTASPSSAGADPP